mgnify:CR=1 FL=1
MGSPDLGVPTLQALVARGHHIVGVYTQPDKPRGRGQQLQPCPLKAAAQRLNLPVFSPAKLTPDACQALATLRPDLILVMAYGLLLPPAVLALCPCLNTHVSDLPRWRGAAPMQRALMAGDTHTALCLMGMEAGLDTGPIYLRVPLTLPPDMTFGDLYQTMQDLCANTVPEFIENWSVLGQQAQPQATTGVTYAHKITAADLQLDFTRSALDLHNQIRGLSPSPGARLELAGQSLKILRTTVVAQAAPAGVAYLSAGTLLIGTGAQSLGLLSVQPAGKKPMRGDEFWHGQRFTQPVTVTCPAIS